MLALASLSSRPANTPITISSPKRRVWNPQLGNINKFLSRICQSFYLFQYRVLHSSVTVRHYSSSANRKHRNNLGTPAGIRPTNYEGAGDGS